MGHKSGYGSSSPVEGRRTRLKRETLASIRWEVGRSSRRTVKSAILFLWAGIATLMVAGCAFTTGQIETSLCSNGVVVADPQENPGLVADCVTLLGIRDTLAGDASLNWRVQLSMYEWEGVSVDKETAPLRVTEVSLESRGLTGEIPAAFSALSYLEELWLHDNRLTGGIPAELGSLVNLEWLWLYDNRLTGTIPVELGALADLVGLGLHENHLTGTIPVELGALAELEWLRLDGNRLTGTIPVGLGKLANLEGEIPAEMGALANLEGLGLQENHLAGAIPVELGTLSNLE